MKSFFLLVIYNILLLVSTICFAYPNPKDQTTFNNNIQGFIENKGQITDQYYKPLPFVFYKASIKNLDVYITESGLTYVINEHPDVSRDIEKHKKLALTENKKNKEVKQCRIDLDFKQASIKKENIHAEFPTNTGISNYYLGYLDQPILGVRSYNKIKITDIYPFVDWVLYFNDNGEFKYDFIVKPGGNVNQIRLQYKGASEIKLSDSANSLLVNTPLGSINEGKLVCYESSSEKIIKSKFTLVGDEISFQLEEYNTQEALVIDPLVWASYLSGSTHHDALLDITSDLNNNIYITGVSGSTNFPTFNPGSAAFFQANNVFSAGIRSDVVILKFNSNGQMLWATYYGGTGDEIGEALVTDYNDNLYIVGTVFSKDFPTQDAGGGAYYQPALATTISSNAFIIKFDNNGARLWATYFGGNYGENGEGIARDINNNIYITGQTSSSDFPVQHPGGGTVFFQGNLAGGGSGSNSDAYISKFTSAGVLTYSSYLGGSDNDWGLAVAVDFSGNILITGSTESSDFPLYNPGGNSYFQSSNMGGYRGDIFITKLSASYSLTWSTFYGGSDEDIGHAIANDLAGNVYITGETRSTNFPTYNPGGSAYFWASYTGNYSDIYLLKFDNSGQRKWATYYPGNGIDMGYDLTTDNCGNLYVTGRTDGGNVFGNFHAVNPGNNAYFQTTNGDIFILKFDTNAVCRWATLYGNAPGGHYEMGYGIVAQNGCVFVTGEADGSGNIPTFNPGGGAYYDPTNPDIFDDGFIAQFCCDFTDAISEGSVTCIEDSVQISLNSCYNSFLWSNGSTASSITVLPSVTTTYSVSVMFSSRSCPDTITIHPLPVAYAGKEDTVCIGQTTSLVGSGGANFLWDTGESTQSINVSPSVSTIYSLTVSNGTCMDSDQVLINVLQGPIVNLGNDTTIISGSNIVLNGNGIGNYLWQPSTGLSCNICKNTTASPNTTTTYTLQVTDENGCIASDVITIFIDNDCGKVSIPNAFSPNDDGQNDFLVLHSQCIKQMVFSIYNRWGEKVFETNDPNNYWDGSFKNKKMNSGVFVYKLNVLFLTDQEITKTGDIYLIR